MTDINVVVCLAFDHRAPTDGLQKFKDCIVGCPFVERAMEVCGTFDLIVQGRCGSLAEYNENISRLRAPIAKFVARLETNFVGRLVERTQDSTPSSDAALWLPCKDGRKRVECRMIDKIVAEGDYMRVHVADWNCLIHQTMEQLFKQLKEYDFIKLHRSWLVRANFIDRLIHNEHRWVARLKDGSHVVVAKSHVRDVLKLISGESSNGEGGSTIQRKVAEASGEVNEKLMNLAD